MTTLSSKAADSAGQDDWTLSEVTPLGRSWPTLRASLRASAGRLSLFAGALTAALFAVKMLRVARGDPAVALAVAESSAKSAVASGLLVLTAPLLIALVWMLAWMAARQAWAATCRQLHREAGARQLQPVGWLAGCVLAIVISGWLALVEFPWPAAVFCGVITVPALYAGNRLTGRSTKPLPKWFEKSPERTLAAIVVLFAVCACCAIATVLAPILDDRMWLPAHRLTMTNGFPVVGFILGRDDSTVVVLREADRSVLLLRSTEIRTESICELDLSSKERSVWDASWHRRAPDTPPCY